MSINFNPFGSKKSDNADEDMTYPAPAREGRDIQELRLHDTSIRPTTLDDIIGQPKIRRTLNVFVRSAARRDEALDHVLLYGPPGLGKTTIASVISHETGGRFVNVTGPQLTPEKLIADVIPLIINTHDTFDETGRRMRVVLFIDEIHGLSKETQTLLLPMVEDFKFEDLHIPRFTLVGATTDPARIVGPLRDRFGITYPLEYYGDEDIMHILTRSLGVYTETADWKIAEMLLPGDGIETVTDADDRLIDAFHVDIPSPTRLALLAIAGRSNGTPRIANHLLRRALDFAYAALDDVNAAASAVPVLTPDVVRTAMRALGIDRDGLDRPARDMLRAMLERFGDRAVGVRAVAASIGEAYANVEEVIEPQLVRKGFINRESRGRKLTADGMVKAALEMEGETQW